MGVNAFALQADVTNPSDLWASRGHVVEHMGGQGPDVIVCNSDSPRAATGLVAPFLNKTVKAKLNVSPRAPIVFGFTPRITACGRHQSRRLPRHDPPLGW